ncbi:GTPase IMAP family member 4 [Sardina pilchardus]|uniref:GTPase IMAP family member 4 n=1 Tax=Sardina pilchardus TaxID=27697 RepID=UPI002E15840C
MERENVLEYDERTSPQTEVWRRQERHQEAGEEDEAMEAVLQRGGAKDEMQETQHGASAPPASSSPPPLAAGPELRLVLLGQTGAGKSAAGNSILGRRAFEIKASGGATGTHGCESRTATVAGRQLTVVDTPDWFRSELSPEDIQQQIRSCLALVAPGPHAFLLCVPVDQPASVELLGLEALEAVFGPGAVGRHTLLLFTHMDRLSEGLSLEDYVTSRERRDLLKLVERCGDHYHALERGRGGGGGGGGGGEGEQEETERRSVEELLQKVEQVVRESGVDFHAWPPAPKEPEQRGGLRRDRDERSEMDREPVSSSPSAPSPPEPEEEPEPEPEPEPEAEAEAGPAQAPDTTETRDDDLTEGGDDLVEGDDDDPSLAPAAPPPSFLRGLWDTLVGWLSNIPGLVRGTSLLGSLVGFFVGGPVGRMLGGAVGSVATEVGRRRRVKKTQ